MKLEDAMKLDIRPGRVMVELVPPEEQSRGGIIIPDKAKEQRAEAIVRKAAPDVTDMHEGDRVYVSMYVLKSFPLGELDKDRLTIIPADQIEAVLRGHA